MFRVIILISLELLAVSASPRLSGLPSGEVTREAGIELFNEHHAKLFDKDAKKLPFQEVYESIEIVRYLNDLFKLTSSDYEELERLLKFTDGNVDTMIRKSTASNLFAVEHPNLRDVLLKNLTDQLTSCMADWFRTNTGGPILQLLRDHVFDFEFVMSRAVGKWRPLLPASLPVGITRLAKEEVGNDLLVRQQGVGILDFERIFETQLKSLVSTPCQDFLNHWRFIAGSWTKLALQSDYALEKSFDHLFLEFIDVYQICQSITENPKILDKFVDEKYKYLIEELDKSGPQVTLTSSQTRVALSIFLDPLRNRIDSIKFRWYYEVSRPLAACHMDVVKVLYQIKEVEQNGNLRLLLQDSAQRQFGVCLVNAKEMLNGVVALDSETLKDYSELDMLVSKIDSERQDKGRGTRFYDELTDSDFDEGIAEYWKQPKCFASSNPRKGVKSKFKKICKYLADKLTIEATLDWIDLAKLDIETATNGLNANLERYLKRALLCNWIRTVKSS